MFDGLKEVQEEVNSRLDSEVGKYFIENADKIIIIHRPKKNFCGIIKNKLKKKVK